MKKFKGLTELRRVFRVFAFVFLIWGCYRFLIKLPDEVEELFLKPLVFLGPIFWVLRREKRDLKSVGWSTDNFFRGMYLGIGLGMVFAAEGLLVNYIKYGGFNFMVFEGGGQWLLTSLVLALATAISEETVFRGFIMGRLLELWKDEISATLVSSILFVIIHWPVTFFVLKYNLYQMIVHGLLVFVFSFGSCFLYARTRTLVASVLTHVMWSFSIILFR